MERKTRFELATSTLATWSSTTELLPLTEDASLCGGIERDYTRGDRARQDPDRMEDAILVFLASQTRAGL